jgi:hypothetical protein
MNTLKLLLAGAAAGVILAAFRDFENAAWLAPSLPNAPAPAPADEHEPVLGYDGMDVDTLMDWLPEAQLDRSTLRRIRAYESAHRARRPVLSAVDDLIG